jgi:hypothetical protein
MHIHILFSHLPPSPTNSIACITILLTPPPPAAESLLAIPPSSHLVLLLQPLDEPLLLVHPLRPSNPPPESHHSLQSYISNL